MKVIHSILCSLGLHLWVYVKEDCQDYRELWSPTYNNRMCKYCRKKRGEVYTNTHPST